MLLSEDLWHLHELAMSASNEPSRETIRSVQKQYKKVERRLAAFYEEEMAGALERTRSGR